MSTTAIKCLVYGQAGIGKTRLMRTAPQPLILSAEGGLLSLRKENLPFLEIKDMNTFFGVFQWLYAAQDNYAYRTIGIDSASEIAETILAAELKNTKDPRKAYGELVNQMMAALRAYRDLPYRHVVFTAKMAHVKDQNTGGLLWGPSMPGQQLDQQVPYLFDEMFHLGAYRDAQGQDFTALRTRPDNQYQAKDRSGALDAWEQPDLNAIFDKIMKG
jgi:hypothetical protein